MSIPSNSKNGEKLRFRDPNARDTVLRLHSGNGTQTTQATPQAPASESKEVDGDNKDSPILAKIKSMLAQSNPEKWERFGDELNSSNKYPKPHETWEMVYCIDIQNGLLVFRKSQGVTSQYFGGGYTITPSAIENYYIELRPRAWDPRTLIDPYFRSSLDKDKQVKLLADGDVARNVYNEVSGLVSSFSSEKRKETVQQLENLNRELIDRAHASEATAWTKSEPEAGVVSYKAEFDGITVEIARMTKNDLSNYRLSLTREKISSRIADATLSKNLFDLVDDKNKTAALEALSDVLEGAGF